MAQGTILSNEVRDLLHEHVTSLEQLEAVLLLRQSNPREWTVAEVSKAVRIPVDLMGFALQCLSLSGLVARLESDVVHYRYAPQSGELDRAVEALAHAYTQNPSETIRLLTRFAIDRVRFGASRAFADAFLIGKRNKDG